NVIVVRGDAPKRIGDRSDGVERRVSVAGGVTQRIGFALDVLGVREVFMLGGAVERIGACLFVTEGIVGEGRVVAQCIGLLEDVAFVIIGVGGLVAEAIFHLLGVRHEVMGVRDGVAASIGAADQAACVIVGTANRVHAARVHDIQ